MAKPRHVKKHVRQSGIYTSDKKARKHIASREHKDTYSGSFSGIERNYYNYIMPLMIHNMWTNRNLR